MSDITPDYTRDCGRLGGKLEDVVPQPVLRKWPAAYAHGVKRKVRVRVTKFTGIGHHYYVSLTEEDNVVWQTTVDDMSERPFWMKPWEDPEGRGRDESKRCFTIGGVDNFIRRCVEKHFPSETHYLETMHEDELRLVNNRWHYNEGD